MQRRQNRSSGASGAARSLAIGLLLTAAIAAVAPCQVAARAPSVSGLAERVRALSEPGGFFDTDNLISNESSYLRVVSRLRAMGVNGGAYIGVGPDQNFSYIAAIRANVAYVVDIRRDNLLQHLMFKVLFARSRNRLEYLCRWLGRVPPPTGELASWDERSIDEIVRWVARAPANADFARKEEDAIVAAATAVGYPLSEQDVATLRRFYRAFVADGLELRFTSYNRGPRPYYPSLRQLVLETDEDGRKASYLATEAGWRYVKGLQAADKVIPVIGNLAGPTAMAAVGRDIAGRGDRVSVIYTSNVEQYIWRDGSFRRFAENISAFPRARHSVIIRSYFGAGSGGERHPLAQGASYSTQLLQPLDDFVERANNGGWTSYWELVTRGNRE